MTTNEFVKRLRYTIKEMAGRIRETKTAEMLSKATTAELLVTAIRRYWVIVVIYLVLAILRIVVQSDVDYYDILWPILSLMLILTLFIKNIKIVRAMLILGFVLTSIYNAMFFIKSISYSIALIHIGPIFHSQFLFSFMDCIDWALWLIVSFYLLSILIFNISSRKVIFSFLILTGMLVILWLTYQFYSYQPIIKLIPRMIGIRGLIFNVAGTLRALTEIILNILFVLSLLKNRGAQSAPLHDPEPTSAT